MGEGELAEEESGQAGRAGLRRGRARGEIGTAGSADGSSEGRNREEAGAMTGEVGSWGP